MKTPKYSLTLSFFAISATVTLAQTTIDFGDVDLSTPPTQSYAGGGVFYNGSDSAGSFVSGGATFENSFTDWGGGFTSWSGWAYSTTTDTTTTGFGNQYSALPGSGDGDSVYAVSYVFNPVTIEFGGLTDVSSVSLTNTTYAGLSMEFGDSVAKKFGGDDGTDEDYLLLTIEGLDASDLSTGTVEFYLADYRSADSGLDYIIDTWETVDLSSLGDVNSLSFSIASSDTGGFGINTPTYFALDNLTFTAIPEPGAISLFVGLIVSFISVRRRR